MEENSTIGISAIVTWRNRPELGRALPSISRCLARHGGDLTIVNYDGDSSMLLEMVHGLATPTSIVDVSNQLWFNKSKAQNIGTIHSQQQILFFCDCDILLNDDSLDELFVGVASDVRKFGTIAGVTETERNSRKAGNVVMFGYHLKIRLSNGRMLEIVDNEEDVDDGTRQAPGLLMVHRSSFERVGGYNGCLHGWGWEDQDMIARLTLSEGLERIQKGHAWHISHDDDARTRHYPPTKDRWESRDRMFREALANYDSGDFSGTLKADVMELSSLCNVHVYEAK